MSSTGKSVHPTSSAKANKKDKKDQGNQGNKGHDRKGISWAPRPRGLWKRKSAYILKDFGYILAVHTYSTEGAEGRSADHLGVFYKITKFDDTFDRVIQIDGTQGYLRLADSFIGLLVTRDGVVDYTMFSNKMEYASQTRSTSERDNKRKMRIGIGSLVLKSDISISEMFNDLWEKFGKGNMPVDVTKRAESESASSEASSNLEGYDEIKEFGVSQDPVDRSMDNVVSSDENYCSLENHSNMPQHSCHDVGEGKDEGKKEGEDEGKDMSVSSAPVTPLLGGKLKASTINTGFSKKLKLPHPELVKLSGSAFDKLKEHVISLGVEPRVVNSNHGEADLRRMTKEILTRYEFSKWPSSADGSWGICIMDKSYNVFYLKDEIIEQESAWPNEIVAYVTRASQPTLFFGIGADN